MITIVKKINNDNEKEVMNLGKKIINEGGLVAFPTETVYGLGADALNKNAVKKIYKAKGRPSDNPLIVHIGDIKQLEPLIIFKNDKASILIKNFWPGPLTLIFKKSDIIPIETSGGLDTVGIRFPSNVLAQKFINACETPIAAPSANTSGKPSPTKLSHVVFDLDGKIEMIIDGGDSEYGLESTIVDVTTNNPVLLRPGSITKEMIEDKIGRINIEIFDKEKDQSPKAPGMKYKHYSPLAKIIIIKGDIEKTVVKINSLAKEKYKSKNKVGIIATDQTFNKYDSKIFFVQNIGNRNNPKTIALNLYKVLRKFDYMSIDYVFSESFEESQIGKSVMNRLEKAADFNIIDI